MRKPSLLLSILPIILLLVSCSPAPVIPTPLFEPMPSLEAAEKIESAPCPFDVPESPLITCGKLAVPEDYRSPKDKQIHLMVVTIHRTGQDGVKDPVIVQYSDPGSFNLLFVQNIAYDPLMAEILKERDLVFYDMRGVEYSEPDTACPEYNQAQYDLLGLKGTRSARAKTNADALLECRRKLLEAGIHLELYTTAQNVADLNALVSALEVTQVNLLGMGYGGYLAMRVAQDYPDRIRSILIASPYNSQLLSLNQAANAKRVFSLMFERCKADEKCRAAFPKLEEDFYATAEKLNRTPVELSITASNKTVPVVVTGDLFLDLARTMASRTDIASLPKLVQDININRAYNLMEPLQNYLGFNEFTSSGVSTSVYCQAYLEAKAAQRSAVDAPQALREWQEYNQQADEQICANWFTGQVEPSENPGRTTRVPSLVISSDGNPYIPPEWVKSNSKSLNGAKLVELTNTGWAYWGGDCLGALATAFLKDPSAGLDTGCAKKIPAVKYNLPLQ